MAVDIGAEAIDRTSSHLHSYTIINKVNPASAASLITSIDIWAYSNITGLRVGTFYTTNGNTLKCRDSEAITGTITAGDVVNKVVSITVGIGDYIGCWWDTGDIERAISGSAGFWRYTGEAIDPGDEEDYTLLAGDVISLGGYLAVSTPVADGDLIGIGIIRKT